jgi:hypothetical protein
MIHPILFLKPLIVRLFVRTNAKKLPETKRLHAHQQYFLGLFHGVFRRWLSEQMRAAELAPDEAILFGALREQRLDERGQIARADAAAQTKQNEQNNEQTQEQQLTAKRGRFRSNCLRWRR